MENNDNLSVFKSRSSRACIGAGYHLYMSNFRRIFRSSWIVAILYAVVYSIFTTFVINEYPRVLLLSTLHPEILAQMGNQLAVLGGFLLAGSVACALMSATLASYGFAAFAAHQQTDSVPYPAHWYGSFNKSMWVRVLKAMLWALVVSVVTGVIMSAVAIGARSLLNGIAAAGLFFVIVIACFIAVLPLNYTFFRYILTPRCSFVSALKATYTTGLRHLGSIFTVSLMVGIIILGLTFFTELPAIILYLANLHAQMGAVQGDPLGMPHYILWLDLAVFALACFIQAYVHLSSLFPYYYLYGKIEQEERERSEALSDTPTQHTT